MKNGKYPSLGLARKKANRSSEFYRVGVVIRKKGKTVSSFNSKKTDPNYGIGLFTSLHAETRACKKFSKKWSLRNTEIFICRIGRDDTLRASRPCKYCEAFLRKVGVRKVTFYNSLLISETIYL